MKQHRYEYNFEKINYPDMPYAIYVNTDNYSCYQEVKDAIIQIVTDYEMKERADDAGNGDN